MKVASVSGIDLTALIWWIGGLVGAGYVLHRLALWAESRGWIYYRSRGRGGAALSNAMSEFEAVLNPAAEHRLDEERSGQVLQDEASLGLGGSDGSAEVPEKVPAAGYTSVEAAQRALARLEARRERLIDQRISASSVGGDDFGGGMRVEQWRDLNDAIDSGSGLVELERRISDLKEILS